MGVFNESWSERMVRVALGLLLLYLGWGDLLPGWLGVELITIGVFALVTGVIGWCPMNAMFGRGTRSRVSHYQHA